MNRNKIRIGLVVIMAPILAAAIIFLLGRGAVAGAQEGTAAGESSLAAAVSPLLQYQGRLSDPATGEAVEDGSYTMAFRLYEAPSGGTAVWIETKDVPVRDGLFSTLLGDSTPLDQGLFNGRALWLGIKVGADEEAMPRQQMVPVVYALSLVPGASIETKSGGAALNLTNDGSGPALNAQGQVDVAGDLTVGGALLGGSHTHSAADINSGLLADARIPAAVARDAEVASALDDHAGKAAAHHTRYTDAEAVKAALSSPEIVTQYEFQDHIYGGMHYGRALAFGTINEDGSIATSSGNISSKWNNTGKFYEISIDGQNYDWRSYVTVVTPVLGGIPSAWSASGSSKLYVGIYEDSSSPGLKTPFSFVTFKP